MAKVKTEKLNFSKFFPESTAFVSINGEAKGSDDFHIDVKIGDGEKSVSLWTSDWYKGDPVATLKAIQEGVTKALEFQQKALKMPKMEIRDVRPWDNFIKDSVVPATKKAATKKKK